MQVFFIHYILKILNNCVDSFNKFFNIGVAKRHRKPIIGGTDLTKKHLNIVPAKYKTPIGSNPKIETLKKRPGRFMCDHKDVDFITTTFLKGIAPKKNEFKMLGGKLGIKFYFDTRLNKWVMEKQ
jgi:hypothetical protein